MTTAELVSEFQYSSLGFRQRLASIRIEVTRGIAALDLCWPGWWYSRLPLPAHWLLMLWALVHAAGDQNWHMMRCRAHGLDYFFNDENETATALFSREIRRRRIERRTEWMVALAREWEGYCQL